MSKAQQDALGSDEADKTMKLPSVLDTGGETIEPEEMHGQKSGGVKFPKVSRKVNLAQTQGFSADATQPMGDADAASKAPLTRTTFLKETAQMVKRMKTVRTQLIPLTLMTPLNLLTLPGGGE
jgi:hypothetical protein